MPTTRRRASESSATSDPDAAGRASRQADGRSAGQARPLHGANLDRSASVAQGIERWFPVPKVAGSIPVGGTSKEKGSRVI